MTAYIYVLINWESVKMYGIVRKNSPPSEIYPNETIFKINTYGCKGERQKTRLFGGHAPYLGRCTHLGVTLPKNGFKKCFSEHAEYFVLSLKGVEERGGGRHLATYPLKSLVLLTPSLGVEQ